MQHSAHANGPKTKSCRYCKCIDKAKTLVPATVSRSQHINKEEGSDPSPVTVLVTPVFSVLSPLSSFASVQCTVHAGGPTTAPVVSLVRRTAMVYSLQSSGGSGVPEAPLLAITRVPSPQVRPTPDVGSSSTNHTYRHAVHYPAQHPANLAADTPRRGPQPGVHTYADLVTDTGWGVIGRLHKLAGGEPRTFVILTRD